MNPGLYHTFCTYMLASQSSYLVHFNSMILVSIVHFSSYAHSGIPLGHSETTSRFLISWCSIRLRISWTLLWLSSIKCNFISTLTSLPCLLIYQFSPRSSNCSWTLHAMVQRQFRDLQEQIWLWLTLRLLTYKSSLPSQEVRIYFQVWSQFYSFFNPSWTPSTVPEQIQSQLLLVALMMRQWMDALQIVLQYY